MAEDIVEAVLEQARRGDKTAFDCIQQQYEPTAKRFVWRLVGETMTIEDIVQNTFLALWLNIERIESVTHLRRFLFRVLRNQCYDILRRQGRYQKIALDDVQPVQLALHNHALSPEDQSHWTLIYSAVQDAIDTLPEQQRQTLILYYQFDLSYAEIADAMTVQIGTVKSRLHTARKKLLRILPPELINSILQ